MSNSADVSPAGVGSYYQNTRKEIAPLLPATLNSVLELGCGTGGTMKWLRSVRPIRFAAGIELSAEAAEIARSTFDAVEVGDVNAVPFDFAEKTFDAVIALDVLEHLLDPAAVVRKMRDKINPGGVFIASIPNISHISVSGPLFMKGHWEYRDEGLLDRTHLRFFNRRSAFRLFEDAGYRIVREETNWMPPDIFGLMSHPNRAVRWNARRVLGPIFRWPGHLFALQFLVAAQPV